ncbi:unnamed protein product [Closterium sp. Naga37s-1]|nr:unnamed protein product [Closterium sp. Naga37s-1]
MAMAGGMELRLDGVVVKVQRAETAGEMREMSAGAKERAEELEAQVKRQGEAMAALKREVDEMRRAMAKGALEMMGAAGGNHGAGSAAAGKAGEDVDGLSAQPPPKGEALMALVEAMIEARDAASEARAVIKQQAAEIADVRATAAHIDARMNDVELAVAEWKVARETTREERSDDSDGSSKEHAEAEEREGKKRKREVKGDELAELGGAADDDAASHDKQRGEAYNSKWEVECQGLRKSVEAVESRVANLEKTSGEEKRIWEAMLTLWAATAPEQTRMDLSGISCLTDAALTRLASLRHLTLVDLDDSSGFTAAGMRKLYSLTDLEHLVFGGTIATDASLEGISRLMNLQILVLDNTNITDAGVARLQELEGGWAAASDCPHFSQVIHFASTCD